jgi:AcrR family transcriptional regulator
MSPDDASLDIPLSNDKKLNARGRVTSLAIIDATLHVIDTEGPDAVRIAAIAEQVSVAPASIYHYFGDRGGLIDAALMHRFTRSYLDLNEDIDAALDRVTSIDQVPDIIRGISRIVADDSRMKLRLERAFIVGSTLYRESMRRTVAEATQAAIEDLARIIAKHQARGILPAHIDPLPAASWISSLNFGRLIQDMIGLDVPDEVFGDMTQRAYEALFL